jgi:hypothetical protein
VPLATTVKDAVPVVAHILPPDGWVPIVTGVQTDVTVTITLNGVPVHVPDTGVTVYTAVPVPEGIDKTPLIFVCALL